MSDEASPRPGPRPDPLDEFADCHLGILARLESFRSLPDLLDPIERAQRIASRTIEFFDRAVLEHHADEERELFPTVLASAGKGPEREQVQLTVDRMTGEHRQIETMWSRLEPSLKEIARGHRRKLDAVAVQRLVDAYLGHARYEERIFLPLAKTILGRHGNQLAGLGMSLHERHADAAAIVRVTSQR